MNFKNILIRAVQGGYRMPHTAIREMFDLQGSSYRFVPHLPSLFIHSALGISYKSDRDDLEGTNGYWRSEGSIADQWSIAFSPDKKYPAIPMREGILHFRKQDGDPLHRPDSTGPQVMYNYYQGEFGGPKLAIMIVDGTEIERRGFYETGVYKVADPVRFALFARQNWKDDAMNGDLIITHILMDGRYLPLDEAHIGKALAYGKALFEQIKGGKEYDPAKALSAAEDIPAPSVDV